MDQGYLTIKQLAAYSGIGSSSLRYHIANSGLPCFRIPGANGNTGRVLVKRSEFDGWIEQFRANDYVDPDAVANDVIQSLSDE